ncbi:MAG: hypothetical protein M3R70_06375 [Actinomycetota bacterium]|nr:hypothetical protein [Actinomycetota bacterium]
MKRRLRRSLMIAALGVGALLLLVAFLAAPAGAKKPKKKRGPDLVVTWAELTAPVNHYLFANELGRVVFSDRTKNIGSRRAGRSFTYGYLGQKATAGPGLNILGPRRPVRPLKPGQANKGTAEKSSVPPLDLIGAYYAAAWQWDLHAE